MERTLLNVNLLHLNLANSKQRKISATDVCVGEFILVRIVSIGVGYRLPILLQGNARAQMRDRQKYWLHVFFLQLSQSENRA